MERGFHAALAFRIKAKSGQAFQPTPTSLALFDGFMA
jgi:hypothetical protein